MYRELSIQAKKQKKNRRIILVAIAVLLALGLWFVFNITNANLREQGELSVRNAILGAAKQAFAIEGAYPISISHLEESYGLVINHDNYIVTYEVFAENVMPSVVVIAR